MTEHGTCTCHQPPLPMHRDGADAEWGHDTDDTYAEVFHVHSYSTARDCDGVLDRDHTYQLTSITPQGEAMDKGNLWRHLCRMELVPYGQQQITINGDEYSATFERATDEGYAGAIEFRYTKSGYCGGIIPRDDTRWSIAT